MHLKNSSCVLCKWGRERASSLEHQVFLANATGADQLISYLQGLSSSKREDCRRALIRSAIASQGRKDLLMSLTGSVANELLVEMLKLLDSSKECKKCAGQGTKALILRRLLIGLSKKAQLLPDSLFVEGVICNDKNSVACGGYADVYRAVYCGREVALKRMRVFSSDSSEKEMKSRELFHREALVWQSMTHPNIQPFIGMDLRIFGTYPCMVSPWQGNGNIVECLERIREDMRFLVYCDEWIRQIARGLGYLHRNDIVHGDLRGANVLIDEHFSVRLTDFGLAGIYGANTSTQGSGALGAIRICAPELVAQERCRPSFASDMYAFGCLCLEVSSGRPPFPELDDPKQVMAQLLKGICPKTPSSVGPARRSFWEFVERCWSINPTQRPSSDTLTSFPSQDPLISIEELRALPHTHTRHSNVFASFTWWFKSHVRKEENNPEMEFIDPCIIGIISFDTAEGSVSETLNRLSERGFPAAAKSQAQELLQTALSSIPQTQSSIPEVISSWISSSNSNGQEAPSGPQAFDTLKKMSSSLVEAQKYDEALGFLQHAVQICRDLAQDQPATFDPLLADTLGQMYRCLCNLKRGQDAIPFAQESIGIYHNLNQQDPGKFSEILVESFINLAMNYSDLGRHDEAEKCIRQAIDLSRDLSQKEPEKYKTIFAEALHQLDHILGNQGRHDEAVDVALEMVQIYRSLDEIHPGKFKKRLADFLKHLSADYLLLKKHEEAVQPLHETIQIRRDLARENPEKSTPPLADSLHQLQFALYELRRYEDALEVAKEVVDIYRELRKLQPGKFEDYLANSLYNLSSTYMRLERVEEAVTFFNEVATIRRRLVQAAPERYQTALAEVLHRLDHALHKLGRYQDAIEAAAEEVSIFRDLNHRHQGKFNRNLANALYDLALDHFSSGSYEEVGRFLRESIELLQKLEQMNPGRFKNRIENAFGRYYDSLIKLERYEEALRVDQERNKMGGG